MLERPEIHSHNNVDMFLLVFLDCHNQWPNIIASSFIVLHVRAITERKSARLPATAIDFLSLCEGYHGCHLRAVKVNLLVDTVLKKEVGLNAMLSDKGEGRGRREKESSGSELHGDD